MDVAGEWRPYGANMDVILQILERILSISDTNPRLSIHLIALVAPLVLIPVVVRVLKAPLKTLGMIVCFSVVTLAYWAWVAYLASLS